MNGGTIFRVHRQIFRSYEYYEMKHFARFITAKVKRLGLNGHMRVRITLGLTQIIHSNILDMEVKCGSKRKRAKQN